MAGSLVAGLLVWTTVLSLIALAASAWVRWKVAAGALILGVFFIGAGFGSAVNNIMRTDVGTLLNLPQVMYIVWIRLFGAENIDTQVSAGSAWTILAVWCALCVWLLTRKVRALEVVK